VCTTVSSSLIKHNAPPKRTLWVCPGCVLGVSWVLIFWVCRGCVPCAYTVFSMHSRLYPRQLVNFERVFLPFFSKCAQSWPLPGMSQTGPPPIPASSQFVKNKVYLLSLGSSGVTMQYNASSDLCPKIKRLLRVVELPFRQPPK